jgi:hypothetical protein
MNAPAEARRAGSAARERARSCPAAPGARRGRRPRPACGSCTSSGPGRGRPFGRALEARRPGRRRRANAAVTRRGSRRRGRRCRARRRRGSGARRRPVGDDATFVGDGDVFAGRRWHAREAPYAQRGVERRDASGGRTRDRDLALPSGRRAGIHEHAATGLDQAAAADELVDLPIGDAALTQAGARTDAAPGRELGGKYRFVHHGVVLLCSGAQGSAGDSQRRGGL